MNALAELNDFFENAAVPLHWVGPDGTILRANRAELELLGYRAEEYVGRRIAEFHTDQNAIAGILRRLHAGEELRDYEASLRCKDGSIKHVLISSNVRFEDGKFVHTRCFTRDITDRKRMEEALATELADLQQLHEISLQLIREGDVAVLYEHLLDAARSIMKSDMATMQVVDEQENALRLLAFRGYDRDIRDAFGIVRPGDQTCCAMAFQTGRRVIVPDVRRCDFIQGPARAAHLEHGIQAVQSTPLVSRTGRLLGMISTHWREPHDPPERHLRLLDLLGRQAADLVERRLAEAAQRRQSERLQLLWESASVLLTADDPDAMLHGLFAKIGPHLGVDTYFNFMVDERGDALRLASYSGIPVETARRIARLEFGQAVCGNVAVQREPIVATHIQRSDEPMVQLAKSFGLRAYACQPLLSDNRLLGTLSFASRTKDAFDPDELTFLQTISRYVTVAYERLRLVWQLREADRRKDEFLATLAHELRNPLAPVRNAVQVLRLKGTHEPEVRWCRDVIERQVDYLTRLIDDLLDIARITRNKLELRMQRVELAEVLQGAIESSRPLIDQCGHTLTVTIPPEPIHLQADLVRLAQVFLNLLNNAAKYTERGGRIELIAERERDGVAVRIKDNGVGIPPDKLPHLFEIFFQVDGGPERSQGGLGIGLSLVRRLVELHGGTVEVGSGGVGKGSEFIVRLPVLETDAEQPRQPAPPGQTRTGRGRRVLVVDDNRDAADSLAMVLRLHGDQVDVAYDGVVGLAAAERLRPDVILLDIGLPGLSGDEACRRLRSAPWGQDVLLIALTGWGQDDDRRDTMAAGFDAHVVKPANPDDLLELFETLRGRATLAGYRAG